MLDADNLHFRAQVFQIGANTRNQTAPAHRHKNRVQRIGVLSNDLHPDRALTGNDIGIIKRVDERVAFRVDEFHRMRKGVVKTVALQNDFRASTLHGINLDRRRIRAHHNGCRNPQARGRQRDALRMVARTRRDHALFPERGVQPLELVVGAATLEAEDRLKVFTFQQDRRSKPFTQRVSGLQRRLDGHVINARLENLLDVLLHDHKSILARVGQGETNGSGRAEAPGGRTRR